MRCPLPRSPDAARRWSTAPRRGGRLGAALALLALATSCAHAPEPRPLPQPALGAERWRADLAYLARELPRRHRNAFHHVSRDSFDRAVVALDHDIPGLGDDAIVVGLRRLTAIVGDAHTGLLDPVGFHRYPLVVRPFGDAYRVTQVTREAAELLGGTLVRVGDVPVDEVLARVAGILPQAENAWYVRGVAPSWLVHAEALHALGVSADPGHATYVVADSAGREVAATLAILPPGARIAWVAAAADTPLYLRRRSASLWCEPLAGDSCLYVAFRRYVRLARFTCPMWDYVDRHHVRTLIVDLRQNGGGNYLTGRRRLVAPARRRLRRGTLRDVIVLVGNSTFSAAMINALDFRTRCDAVLVGEPIGERPNSYSERRMMTLPESRLVVTYSVRYYRFQRDDDPPTVMPDRIVSPSWDDFRAGRDPVLEWALAHRAR